MTKTTLTLIPRKDLIDTWTKELRESLRDSAASPKTAEACLADFYKKTGKYVTAYGAAKEVPNHPATSHVRTLLGNLGREATVRKAAWQKHERKFLKNPKAYTQSYLSVRTAAKALGLSNNTVAKQLDSSYAVELALHVVPTEVVLQELETRGKAKVKPKRDRALSKAWEGAKRQADTWQPAEYENTKTNNAAVKDVYRALSAGEVTPAAAAALLKELL